MKRKSAKRLAVLTALMGLMAPIAAIAADDDIQKKVDQLTREVQELKGQVGKVEKKSLGTWLSIGGEYRFKIDSLHGQTAAYSDAIGTMMNLVGGFTAPSGPMSVATGTSPNGVYMPSATEFMMMGKSGSLFTKNQFDTILKAYMPQAMVNTMGSAAFFTNLQGVLALTGSLQNAVGATTLTSQQMSILNTLNTAVMPTVVTMMGGQTNMNTAMATMMTNLGIPLTTANQQLFQQYLNNMLIQGFLGANGGNLDTKAAYKPKNETLYTNKFGLDLTAKPIQDVTVHAKLGIYKTFGSQDSSQVTGNYFADRVGIFDGTLGHVPSESLLNVDRAYVTWSNIADQPIWFSIGRRPSTDGAPSNLRANKERPGVGGVPSLMVNYAYDGMTVGYAPDIDTLPGAYIKLCYGRGYDSGLKVASDSLKDMDMTGVIVSPYDTDPLRVWLQWNHAYNMTDFPVMKDTVFGNTAPAVTLGDADWFGAGALSTLKNVGPGSLNIFTDFAVSISRPNSNVSQNAGFQGLLSGEFFAQDFAPKDQTGWAVSAGVRYDLPTKTKIGFEYNHGSKYWFTMAFAADDMWTSKVGTRGSVYEPYIIQELNLKPLSSHLAKAFFKLGYQYYDFEYTGSNNWVGAPQKISDIKPTDLMLMAPLKEAHNVYGTFEVQF